MVDPYPDAPAQRTSNTGTWIDRHRSPKRLQLNSRTVQVNPDHREQVGATPALGRADRQTSQVSVVMAGKPSYGAITRVGIRIGARATLSNDDLFKSEY
ncbi:MAG: hypothetical protein DMF76_15985 [Acidobacteria bacterium]|nr:MAG: hypothetical protein DMF76_15985 [Acidobacteriota bacterium]